MTVSRPFTSHSQRSSLETRILVPRARFAARYTVRAARSLGVLGRASFGAATATVESGPLLWPGRAPGFGRIVVLARKHAEIPSVAMEATAPFRTVRTTFSSIYASSNNRESGWLILQVTGHPHMRETRSVAKLYRWLFPPIWQ